MIHSIENGYKFIELDLLLSNDGVIYAAHDEKHFNEITGFEALQKTKPSIQEVKERLIFNQYHTLTIDEINEIFLQHSDLFLVTDKLNDFEAMSSQIPYLDRIIVEVFDKHHSLKNYKNALSSGIKYPALSNRGDFAFAIAKKVPILAMNTRHLSKPLASEYIKMGGCILAFSSNEVDFINANLNNATMFYTDFWDLKNNECILEDKTLCKTY